MLDRQKHNKNRINLLKDQFFKNRIYFSYAYNCSFTVYTIKCQIAFISHMRTIVVLQYILENGTVLGVRRQVLHRLFYIREYGSY